MIRGKVRKREILKLKSRAVFTVEASVILPIVLFITAATIGTAVSQSETVVSASKDVTSVTEFDPLKVTETENWMNMLKEWATGGKE